MKSIPEIIDLAVASTDNLPTAMLRSKVLADELRYEPFKAWVDSELNGYPSKAQTPEYRRIRGHLRGQFQRYLEHVGKEDVPRQTLGPDVAPLAETIFLHQGVGILANLPDDGTVYFPLEVEKELLQLINLHFGFRGRFTSLQLDCPPGALRPVVVTIQHKLVSLLSEINQLFPTQETIEPVNPEQAAELDRKVGHYLTIQHAQTVVVALAGVQIDQLNNVLQQIQVHNWPDLDEFLSKQNVPEDKRQAVKEILDKVEEGDQSQETQQELKQWLGDTAGNMASGMGDIAKETTKKVVSDTLLEGLKRYAPEIAKWGWVLAQT